MSEEILKALLAIGIMPQIEPTRFHSLIFYLSINYLSLYLSLSYNKSNNPLVNQKCVSVLALLAIGIICINLRQ